MDKTHEIPKATGAIPSPEDYRDIPLAALIPAGAAPLPASFFVDIKNIPIWDQNKLGACVGHAGAKYKQKLDETDTKTVYPLSARFVYAMAKCQDGYSDEGTYPRLVAQIMKDFGVATEKTVPNDTTIPHETYVYNRKQNNIPGAPLFPDAAPFKISGYAFPNVKDPESLKAAIVNFQGAMLLVQVGKEWYTDKNGKTSWKEKDVLPLRIPKVVISGHEIYLYGYETVGNRIKFYFVNSWSDEWGKLGIGYFWYDEYKPYIIEAITVVDIPNEMQQTVDQLPTKENFKFNFTKQVSYGQRNSDVVALQTALMIDGEFDKALYVDLLKSNELGYYGTTTQKAVAAYQAKYKLDTIVNLGIINGKYIGPKTRAHLNAWTNK